MKHLKKFNESWDYNPGAKADHELAEQIAKDLFPRFQEMRKNGEEITIDVYDKYMQQRKATSELSDAVMHILIDMGFDFDLEKEEDEEEPLEFELKNKMY